MDSLHVFNDFSTIPKILAAEPQMGLEKGQLPRRRGRRITYYESGSGTLRLLVVPEPP
jgi:hypothetical protein